MLSADVTKLSAEGLAQLAKITLPRAFLDEEKNIDSIIVYNDKNQMYFDVSITMVKEHNLAFAIYKDVTQETLNDEKMRQLRQEMVEVTDKDF